MPMPTDALRAVIYTRVSSDRDGGGRSVGEQEQECRAECDRRGWSVVRVLTDNSYSATRWARKDRPAYAELGRLLTSREVDVLVSWEASRAQRDLAAYVALRDVCTEAGVRWSYSGRLYDLTDDDDRFSTGIDALVSEREAGLTRKRILRSVEKRAERGGAHGRCPDGYLIEYDSTTGKPVRRVIDPDRAPMIREAVERTLSGESAWSIAADFNRRGYTANSGIPWTGGNLLKRLRTPAICGRRVFRGKVLEGVRGDWPAIVDEDTFDRLQTVLADPRRKTTRGGGRVRYQGSGIYRCGKCGGPMRTVARKRDDGSRPRAYRCEVEYCTMRMVEPVDAFVDAVVAAFLARPDVVAELQDADPGESVREAQLEVTQLRSRLDEARAKVAAGAITLDDFAAFRSGWERQLEDAERRARPAWVPDVVFDVAGPHAASRWKATGLEQRRAVLQALFDVRIMPTDKRDGRFDPASVRVERRQSQA